MEFDKAGLRSFADSTAICEDGETLRERLHADGYLFLRGLLSVEPLAALRRKCLNVIAEAGWLREDQPSDDAAARPEAASVDPDDAFVAVLRRLYRFEALHALPHQSALIDLFERILGGAVLAHPLVIPRIVFPKRAEFTTPPHQDYVHIQGTPETYTAWVPLDDCPMSRGALSVARSSHKQGVHDFAVSNGAGGMIVSDPLEGTWHAGDFALGDVLIFHSLSVHRALPNLSDNLRQSIDMRFQRASDPVTELSLSPYAGMGTWENIYEGWSGDVPQYYWWDATPRIVPFDRQYYERRDSIAFEMAERGDGEARAALQRIVQRDPDAAKRDKASQLIGKLDSVAV